MNDEVAGVSPISPCPSHRTESDSRDCISENLEVHVLNMEVQDVQEAPR